MRSHVLVAGLGGVGAYAAESLARAGIGKFTLIDGDVIEETNINRQLLALHSTLGRPKAEVMAERIRDINPDARIEIIDRFSAPDDWEEILKAAPDYVVDAIDTLSPKIYLIVATLQKNIPLISVMGSGGKTDPASVKIADISRTYNDYLARMVRKRLKKHGIRSGFKTVFSAQLPDKNALVLSKNTEYKKSAYGTISYMPALFGLFAAAEVIKDLTEK